MEFILIPVGVLGVLAIVFSLIRARGKRLEAGLRRELGARLELITGCGVVSGLNRVPGVLASTGDALHYRALITGARGEIPLAEITRYTIEDTRTSSHRRTRKYRGAKVIALELRSGERPPLFVVRDSDGPRWEAALGRGGDRRS